MLDVTVANLRAPSALDASFDVVGPALAKAIARKHPHYRGETNFMARTNSYPSHSPPYGDYSVDVHRAPKDLTVI